MSHKEEEEVVDLDAGPEPVITLQRPRERERKQSLQKVSEAFEPLITFLVLLKGKIKSFVFKMYLFW